MSFWAELRQDLQNADWRVQKAALERISPSLALPPDFYPLLMALVRHPTPWVREASVKVLGEVGYQPAVEALLVCVTDSSRWVSIAALEALGHLQETETIPQLIAALNHTDSAVRSAAAKALAAFGPPVEAPLLKALSAPNALVRRGVIEALNLLAADGSILPLIKALYNEKNAHNRRDIRQTLHHLSQVDNLDQLIEQVQAESPPWRQRIKHTLNRLSQAEARRPLILISEGGQDERELLATTLAWRGFRCVEAVNGEAALAEALHHQPDLILLELRLARLDGFQVYQRLQAHPHTRHIPVILLAADTQDSVVQRSRQLGIKGHLSKPYRPSEVVSKVQAVLS